MTGGAAQAWFVAGTIPLMVAGALHALLTLVDVVRPTFFAPIDSSARRGMAATGMRFRRPFPGDAARPSVWSAWLGFNISHGLGVFAFGLLCFLIASHDFELVERIDAIRPLAVAFSFALLALSLRFWFYLPAIVTGAAAACFTVAAVLSA